MRETMMHRVTCLPVLFACIVVFCSMVGCTSSPNGADANGVPSSTANQKLDLRAQELLIEGQKAFQMGQYEQAMAFLDSAEVVEPGVPVIPFNRGRIFTALNRVDDARKAFQESIDRDPGYPEVRRRLGDIEMEQGNVAEALSYYRGEAQIQPDAELYVQMGEAYSRLGQADSAKVSYQKAIESDSTHAQAHMMYGQLLEELGILEEALQHSKSALSIEPASTNHQFAVGSQLYQLGRLEESVHYLQSAADGRLLHYPAQYNLGQVLSRLGRDEEANYYLARADSSRELMDKITNTQSIAAQNPDNAEKWVELGELFRHAGEQDRAIQAFNRATALDPDNLRLQNNIGEMMLAEGDVRGAAQRFQSILRVDEQRPEVWKNLGLAFAVAGLCDDARMALNVAIDYEPENTEYKDLLSGICAGAVQ